MGSVGGGASTTGGEHAARKHEHARWRCPVAHKLLAEREGEPWPVWISFGTPCTGVFLPVYLAGVLPGVLARGSEQPAADPAGSAWWAFKQLQDATAGDFAARTPEVREGWAPFEREVEHERLAAEAEAASLQRDERFDDAARCLTAFMSRTAEAAIARASALSERFVDRALA